MIMSEEKNASQLNKERRHKKHRKYHFAVLPYILTPIVFVLISLIAVVPAGIHMMNTAIDTVHKAQETLSIGLNDVEAKNNYDADAEGKADRPADVSKFGEILCENAGLNADAYYGMNRVSLRNGVGVSAEAALPGDKGIINAYGYASTAFKALKYVKIGDVITFETGWGVYYYMVTDVVTSNKAPVINADQGLIFAAAKDNNAFSCFDDEKLYVAAELISDASEGEVQ